jgi:hypothetical protein
MEDASSSQFGRIRQRISWFEWAVYVLLIPVEYGLLVLGASGWIGRGIGMFILAVVLLYLGNRIFRSPVVETDEEGIVVRPELGEGRIFVKWEDAEEVVVWYYSKGTRMTMIGIRCRPDFEYDNYGRYPVISSNEHLLGIVGPPPYVGAALQQWSVVTGATKARAVATLVNSARRNVKVTEVEHLTERTRDLTVRAR